MSTPYFQKIRNEYDKDSLTEENSQKDPFKQFELWFNEALKLNLPEKNSMMLATINQEGHPTCRVVLLKSYSSSGFVFFTNYNSPKVNSLEKTNYASLLFFWPSLERQLRVEGQLTKTSEKESDEYFRTRPRGSQIAAWASKQSSPIESRKALEESYKKYELQFKEITPIPRPSFWGGVNLKPQFFEFWQGRVNRLHDRITYSRNDKIWRKERLSP